MSRIPSRLAIAAAGFVWLSLPGPARADLVNHWKFDETAGTTAADSEGGLPLTLQDNAQFVADPKRGQVLDLDGSGDFASNAGEPFTADVTHTVGMWVNHDDPGNLSQRWMSWGASGARYFIGPYSGSVVPVNGNVWWGVGNQNAKYTAAGAHPQQNTWEYWTLVREGTDARLYRDGQHVETLNVASGGAISSAGELRLGAQYLGGEYLDGQMDDVAVWNEALTPQQINNAKTFGAANYEGLYEPFDYAGTDISASGVWTDNVPLPNQGRGTVGALSLSGDSTSLDYPSPGNSLGARVADSGGGTAERALGFEMPLASDNDYYVSMLVRGSGILQLYGTVGSADYVRAYLGITDGGEFIVGGYPRVGGQDLSNIYAGDRTYDSDETYLLVAKIDANAGSNDVFYLKVYDESMTPDLIEPTTFDLTASNGSDVNLTHMLIGMTALGEIDEIRVGASWNGVLSVPEPSSAALLLAAALGVLLPCPFHRHRARGSQC